MLAVIVIPGYGFIRSFESCFVAHCTCRRHRESTGDGKKKKTAPCKVQRTRKRFYGAYRSKGRRIVFLVAWLWECDCFENAPGRDTHVRMKLSQVSHERRKEARTYFKTLLDMQQFLDLERDQHEDETDSEPDSD